MGITCLVSMFGAFLIILTYIVFKDLRTLARQQLVNLSVADIIVAGSHFVGLVAFKVEDYSHQEEYYSVNESNNSEPNTLCHVQAGFTMCGTIASFLWSLALGLYLLIVIWLRRPDFARYLVFAYYPICWGVPVALTLWFALVKPTYLGYVRDADVGELCFHISCSVGLETPFSISAWCYIRLVPDSEGHIDQRTTVMAEVVGYSLWFYITAGALVLIYLTMLYYLRCRVCCLYKIPWVVFCISCTHTIYLAPQISHHRKKTRRPTDLKLIFVPLIFLLLRVWSAILNVPTYYFSPPKHPFGTEVTATLVFISVGILYASTFLFSKVNLQTKAKLP